MRILCVLITTAMILTSGFCFADQGTSFEGGTGLLNMNSAKTIGAGHYSVGINWLVMQKKHPVLWSGIYHEPTDYPSILGFPIVFGLTDYLDITAVPYMFHDARELKKRSRVFDYYGKPTTGSGVTRAAAKVRLPSIFSDNLYLAAKVGASLDTADDNLEGINYRWVRDATDIDVSLLQTIDLSQKLSLLFEEGYVFSGDEYFDNQIVFSAGIEYKPTEKWAFGLELNDRTFLYNSPMRALEEGPDPAYYSTPAAIGDPREMCHYEELDWGDDYLLLTPSIRYNLTDAVTLNAGALINLAEDQADPKETVQFYAGITLNGALNFMTDSDKDGVKNNIDREPDTPAGYPVDRYGVSLDSDGDGVPDGRDREKNTRKGAKVDTWGVALDGDGDGVPDGIDREPNTRKGAKVDTWGVALDGDGDGVPDGIDREPNTPRGSRVDEYGVAIKEEIRKLFDESIITAHNIYFDSGKSVIKPESYSIIETVADIFAKYPTLKIRIEGHTDSQGSRALNMRLSRERAEAVLKYILNYRPDLDKTRFSIEGFGPDRPIATNDTAEGRAMNRRVNFTVVNREELKRITP